MAKETVWQRRARKVRSGKADYYPKVNLTDEDTSPDALERIAVVEGPAPGDIDDEVSASEAQDAALVEAEPVEPQEASAPVGDFELAAAEPVEAANDAGETAEALEPAGDLDLAEAAPVEAAASALDEATAATAEANESLDSPAADLGAQDKAETAMQLPEFLDLPAAAPLVKSLLARRGNPIVIDGSAVQQVGAQCVQVLLSAKRTWDADGVPLSIVNCAPRMIEDLELLGVDSATLISGELPQ